LSFAADPVIFANIFVESPDGELAFFFGEPGGCAWKIGKNKKGDTCNGTLQSAPSCQEF
jgi:hypothetical protein